MSLPEPLSRQFERASKHKLSEADAQRVIIEPLLTWLGYDLYDLDQVLEQLPVEGAGRGAFPGAIDYTLKIGKRAHALVEAKIPGVDPRSIAEDRLAVQQINAYCYSHPDRPRWGVLTNGLYWVIYDAQAGGDVFSRVILTIDIRTEPDLLRALSPAWSGHLTRFADLLCEARLVSSGTIRDRAVRDIHREYRETFASPTPGVEPTAAPAIPPSSGRAPPRQSPPSPNVPGSGETATVHRQPPPHAKPSAVLLPSGETPVRSWADVVVVTAEYLLRKKVNLRQLRLPRSERTLVADQGAQSLTKPRVLSDGSVIETNWSSRDCVRVACALLEAAGEPADVLAVRYVAREGDAK